MRFAVLLSAAIALQTTPPATGQAPVRVGAGISPPQKLKDVRPVYPAEAQQAQVQGVVNFALQTSAAASSSTPPDPSMIRLTSSKTRDGTTVWEIPQQRATSLPHWNPDASPVPLSLADAIQTARKWATDRYPQAQRFELQSVRLSRTRRSGDIDFWHYQVDLSGGLPPGGGPVAYVIILLDGSVVEPRIELTPVVYRAGPGVTFPRVVHEVKPRYTSDALRQKISGGVLVEGVVTTDGTLQDLRVVRSLDAVYGLDDEAIKAARQWRFTPGMKDGQAVPVVITIELTFTIGK